MSDPIGAQADIKRLSWVSLRKRCFGVQSFVCCGRPRLSRSELLRLSKWCCSLKQRLSTLAGSGDRSKVSCSEAMPLYSQENGYADSKVSVASKDNENYWYEVKGVKKGERAYRSPLCSCGAEQFLSCQCSAIGLKRCSKKRIAAECQASSSASGENEWVRCRTGEGQLFTDLGCAESPSQYISE
jgi:hypothetical protein